jgi:putative flippase GtrA
MLKSLIARFWAMEIIRFLVVGAFNIGFGYIVTLGIYHSMVAFGAHTTVMLLGLKLDIPLAASILIGIPVAYTMQTLIAFRAVWSFKRMLVYPVTILPNFVIQQGTFFLGMHFILLPMSFKIPIAYALAMITPIPVMFVLVRLIVSYRKQSPEPVSV